MTRVETSKYRKLTTYKIKKRKSGFGLVEFAIATLRTDMRASHFDALHQSSPMRACELQKRSSAFPLTSPTHTAIYRNLSTCQCIFSDAFPHQNESRPGLGTVFRRANASISHDTTEPELDSQPLSMSPKTAQNPRKTRVVRSSIKPRRKLLHFAGVLNTPAACLVPSNRSNANAGT
ncbi:hypothetical protein Poly59_36850 [Rubripirellula reticaptiva]|uniref:Uncharacterized protein n=1 Tax=Rubripirellula reticaptiva TaxID=2528013 RepID=A0A5C6EJ15_9BACT|nr:hypothetical protein Poly59_36850 [Rubripirellula reticaptiva]